MSHVHIDKQLRLTQMAKEISIKEYICNNQLIIILESNYDKAFYSSYVTYYLCGMELFWILDFK